MITKAFPGKTAADIRELTEGMCNVTYNITFSNGGECILKIAAKDRTGNTSNEINLIILRTCLPRRMNVKCEMVYYRVTVSAS